MSKTTIFTGTVESISTRADKTLKVIIGTQELTDEAKMALLGFHQKSGVVAISEKNFAQAEIEAIEAVDIEVADTNKSPSKRLRNVFYRLWQQDNKGYKDPNLHYIYMMEQVITFYKEKLT